MAYRVFLSNRASKFLSRANTELRQRLLQKIKLLSNPIEIDHIKIQGTEDTFRTRLGDYRILFVVLKPEKIVVVSNIDKRSRVYKR